MQSADKSQNLKIEYPCKWEYKIIGSGQEEIKKAVAEIAKGRKHSLGFSKNSKEGKYQSLNLEVLVNSEQERRNIYEALQRCPAIKIIL